MYNTNPLNQMKMFGDMSSMASLLAAAMAANSANAAAAAAASTSAKLPPLGANLNYALQPSMIASLQQDLTNTNNTAQAAALAAAAFKYNSFYNSIDLLNAQKQQQQNYSTSLAKLMSYCYNKPAEYMQRLMAEQTHNTNSANANTFSPNSSTSSSAQSVAYPTPLQFHSNLQPNKSNRFHPYNKPDLNASILKLHQQQQMTINTNSQTSSTSQLSPDISVEVNSKKNYDSPSNNHSALNSRSPSPVESLSNQSVRNQNNISRPSSSLSTDSNDLKTNE